MSWAEVFKINKNMKRSLDEQLQDMKCLPMRVITSTGTYKPEKTGLYKVICVGAGAGGIVQTGASNYIFGGGGGGVAIKNMRLSSSTTYNVTVSTTSSFGTDLSATAGTAGWYQGGYTYPAGGIGVGGDYNFTGEQGQNRSSKGSSAKGGSVGVHITELTRYHTVDQGGNPFLVLGDCLLNYGGGGAALYDLNNYSWTTPGFPAAIIIIPLELEA